MEITAEKRELILATPFDKMVSDLAKPGLDILNSMTFEGFTALASVCSRVVVAGDVLDVEKKVFIYNKNRDEILAPASPRYSDLQSAFLNLSPEKLHMLHMAIGLAGEAAEMLDQICNHVFAGAALDLENVEEEGGDALFYVEGICQGAGLTFAKLKDHNKLKLLGKRYADGKYSDEQAIARADKAEETQQ